MTITPESVLKQARAIWPISWEIEGHTLIGVFEPGNVDLSLRTTEHGLFISCGSGAWAYPGMHSTLPIDAVVELLRDAWWDWFSQQEGAISDLERQVLRCVGVCMCGAECVCGEQQPAPVVWLWLQQIKRREADKHRMMVRVERNRIRTMQDTIRRVLTAYDAQDFDLYSALEALRSLLPESCEGDAL